MKKINKVYIVKHNNTYTLQIDEKTPLFDLGCNLSTVIYFLYDFEFVGGNKGLRNYYDKIVISLSKKEKEKLLPQMAVREL